MGIIKKKFLRKMFYLGAVICMLASKKADVHAQPDVQNAQKIQMAWETGNHHFSSFDEQNALKVDASYGFKIKPTKDTKTTVIKGKSTGELPEIGMPAQLRKFTWFKTEENTSGQIQVKKSNMEIYQCDADGENGRWEKIDVLMTVSNIEKYEQKEGYVAIGNDICDTAYVGIEEMTMQTKFYKAGSSVPVVIKSNVTLKDIDTRQYIGIKADTIHGQYVSRNTKLSYLQSNGMNIYYADNDESYDGEDFSCAGFTFQSDDFQYTFGRIKENGPTGQEQFVGCGQNMVEFGTAAPKKYIKRENGDRVFAEQKTSLADEWVYEVEQPIANGIPKAHRFKKFAFRDEVEKCLKILDVTVTGDGQDVTKDFLVEQAGNNVTATLRNPQDEMFYERSVYTLKIRVKMDIPDHPSEEQLEELRRKWEAHGHYDVTKTMLTQKNKAETIIDEKTAPTNEVRVDLELPEAQKDIPGLEITKKTEKYEYQVKDEIKYDVTVGNTNEKAGVSYFTIEDLQMPSELEIQPDSIKVEGISPEDYELKQQGNGWILKSKGDYVLPYESKIRISYKAKAAIASNGSIWNNVASAKAAGVPKKDAECQIYVNSPKTDVMKTAPQKLYGKGDHIFYKVVMNNRNRGTFMRNVQFHDEIQTDGVRIVPGSLAVVSDGKDITQSADVIYGKDGRSYDVRTTLSLKYGELPIEQSQEAKKTGRYENLHETDEITITYEAVVEKDGLDGGYIQNTFLAPATKNSYGVFIREDSEVPSGGGKAQESVKMKAPALQIIKQSDKKIYSVGETADYVLKVTQENENLTARNVVIEDAFEQQGMEISKISVRLNDKDITDECRIDASKNQFRIETGKNLEKEDLMEVVYQVYFREKTDGGIKNVASAESENTPKDQDENIVVLKPPVLNIKKTSDSTLYKEGQSGIYQLSVTQENDGMTAHDIIIEDAFEKEGMEVSGIRIKYNGKDITGECEVTSDEAKNRFRIRTKKDLTVNDRIMVVYHVLFDRMISGDIKNTAYAYGKDANRVMDENIVEMADIVPELMISKTSDRKICDVGDVCTYEIVAVQKVKDAVARNVVISDWMNQEKTGLQKEEIQVLGPNGEDITGKCKIVCKHTSFRIETGQNLHYGQQIKVRYKVKIEDKLKGSSFMNTAQAKAENTKPVAAKCQVKVRNVPKVSSSAGKNNLPHTGDGSLFPWVISMTAAGACLAFLLKKRYTGKKQ